jgi:adenosylcobinamide-GDP ribazoletransferase
MLEIMEDSHIGAFGAVGLIIYFLGMYIGIYEVMKEPSGIYSIFVMPLIARSMTVFATGFCRYAKPNGMGKVMVDSIKPIPSTILLLLVFGSISLIDSSLLLGAVISTALLAGIIYRIHKTLDGITGDVVGASVEIGQVIFYYQWQSFIKDDTKVFSSGK